MLKSFQKKTGPLIILWIISGLCFANGLEISPILLKVSPTQPVTTLTLTDKSGEPVSYELQANRWTQKNNKDILTPSSSILISPPLVTLAPNKPQVIRIAPQDLMSGQKQTINTEESYRIILKQLPSASKPKGSGVEMLMDFSLPLFVAPKIPANKLVWNAKQESGNEMAMSATNEGNRHARVTELSFKEANGKTKTKNQLAYVLPGQTHTWTVSESPHKDMLAKNKNVHLIATTNNGIMNESLTLS